MKKLWAVLAILLSFTLTLDVAHAKRLGGGKTFGRTYQTAPAPQRSDALPASPAQQQAARPAATGTAPSAGKGMMGGLLGGLLAGGLIAALFAGGAFEGIQFMDILLILAGVFLVMFLLRQLRGGASARQPAYAGAGAASPVGAAGQARASSAAPVFGNRQAAATGVSAAVLSVPMNLPHGFDSPAFLEGAKEHYRILQDAWNRNDLVKIREYVTPELYDQLRVERASLTAEQHTEILALNSELARADQKFGMAEVSIRFSGRYRDAVEGVEEDFTDIWHLQRDFSQDDAPWHITGVETV